MARNIYFSQGSQGEIDLYTDLVIESLRIYGHDFYYLPRKIVNLDTIMNEDIQSKFNEAYQIEMYIENIEGFEGDQSILSKFGLEIRDQATLVVAKRVWEKYVGFYNNNIEGDRPQEGDLIYSPLTRKLFEIRFVEHEQPFYQVTSIPVYKLSVEAFEYNGEEFDTNVDDIDKVETLNAFTRAYITTLVDVNYPSSFNPTIDNIIPIQQVQGDVIITGEAIRYTEIENEINTKLLTIKSIKSNSGEYGTFTTGEIQDADGNRLLDILSEIDKDDTQDGYAKNDDIEREADDIIDFSESNPFGEI